MEPLAQKIGATLTRQHHSSVLEDRYKIDIWFQDKSNINDRIDGLVELLAKMNSLGLTEELGVDLSRSGLSDDGLMKLAASPLVSLRLLQTLVTKEGIAKFRKISKVHALTDFDRQEAQKIRSPDR